MEHAQEVAAAPAFQMPGPIELLSLRVRAQSGYSHQQLDALHAYPRADHSRHRLVENGVHVLVENPAAGEGREYRNWTARMTKVGGKHEREFFGRVSGKPNLNQVPDGLLDGLSVGDVIEFGGDYITKRKWREIDRRYGVVLDVSPDGWLVLSDYDTARLALSDKRPTRVNWMPKAVAVEPMQLAA